MTGIWQLLRIGWILAATFAGFTIGAIIGMMGTTMAGWCGP